MGTEVHAAGAVRRVLVFPLPFQGHINPMFHLAGVLHSRGFAITIFHADFNAPDPSRHPAFDFVPVPDGIVVPLGDGAGATVARILDLNRRCEAPFRDRLAALLEAPGGGGDVACLVADAHLLTLMDVARRLGVPTLALRTGSAASFRIFAAQPMLRDMGYLPARAQSDLDAPVTVLPPAPYRVRDVMMPVGVGVDAQDQMYEIMSRAVKAVWASSGLILNTFDALEPTELAALRRDLAIQVFDVGPLHKLSPPASSSSLLRQDRGCLEWLDTQAPASVLYVSFGSIASMSAGELVETAWGIANSGHPFLWVLRPGLVLGESGTVLPDGFDAATRGRGAVVSWAQQEEVLSHPATGGFWTHCGWNSTMESVCAGVPMLLRPYFGDQPGNARYVERVWRVGLSVDSGGEVVERGKVEAAIRRLMEGEEGIHMRRRAGELKSRAAECIAEAGSSCVSIDKLVNHILSL